MKEFQRASQSQQFKENPNQLLPPKNLDKQQLMLKSSQVHPNPVKHIEEFAKLLISKLAAHKKELDDKKLLKEKLGQVCDGDSSVASLGPTTADQQKKRRYQQQVRVSFRLLNLYEFFEGCLHLGESFCLLSSCHIS